MGFMQGIGNIAGELNATQAQGRIAGSLVQALEQHPGGVGGVLDSLRKNGLGEHVNAWTAGQQPPASPAQVQQGLNGTGLVEKVAEKAGVSPEVAAIAMSTLLPMVVQHFAPGGQAASQGSFGGLAKQFLSRFL